MQRCRNGPHASGDEMIVFEVNDRTGNRTSHASSQPVCSGEGVRTPSGGTRDCRLHHGSKKASKNNCLTCVLQHGFLFGCFSIDWKGLIFQNSFLLRMSNNYIPYISMLGTFMNNHILVYKVIQYFCMIC